MTLVIFVIAAVAGLTLILLSLATLAKPAIHFWPPPQTDSWQYVVFWWLFRTMFVGIMLLCFLDYGRIGQQAAWQYFLGVPLVVLGFGLAFHITYDMGWKDAHGEANGLKTGGWYRWSRNPVYLVSFIGMLGISLVVNSRYVNWLLSLWALVYLLAPLLEEPWLEQQYGEEYSQYKSRVARFYGRRRASVGPG